jgi:hypothetical protein
MSNRDNIFNTGKSYKKAERYHLKGPTAWLHCQSHWGTYCPRVYLATLQMLQIKKKLSSISTLGYSLDTNTKGWEGLIEINNNWTVCFKN